MIRRLVAMLVLLLVAAAPCGARFAGPGHPALLDRLIANVGEHARRHPQDAQARYLLGRLHARAFVGERTAAVTQQRAVRLMEFAPYERSPASDVPRAGTRPDATALNHLARAIENYHRATELDANHSFAWLGLGWILEQGAPHAARAPRPDIRPPLPPRREEWEARALAAYRRAFALERERDLARRHIFDGVDVAVSLEAGEGILRLLKPSPDTAAERRQVQEVVNRLEGLPRAVTPIVFPVAAPAPLAHLIDPRRTVRFDLAGDTRPERWPWLTDQAAFLVWDPEERGEIRSGQQLFGGVTWGMFWRDGYEPLAALDDNRDGWLTGSELRGIAAWRDANGDGRSDPGEVTSVLRLGIVAIAVAATETHDGVPAHPHGLQRSDGSTLPTYDWTPLPCRR